MITIKDIYNVLNDVVLTYDASRSHRRKSYPLLDKNHVLYDDFTTLISGTTSHNPIMEMICAMTGVNIPRIFSLYTPSRGRKDEEVICVAQRRHIYFRDIIDSDTLKFGYPEIIIYLYVSGSLGYVIQKRKSSEHCILNKAKRAKGG